MCRPPPERETLHHDPSVGASTYGCFHSCFFHSANCSIPLSCMLLNDLPTHWLALFWLRPPLSILTDVFINLQAVGARVPHLIYHILIPFLDFNKVSHVY